MLITFEGIDGAGKSTLLRKTVSFLKERGHEVVAYREPGGTPLAEEIREKLLGRELDPVVELFLFEASRASLVKEKVIPDLEAGKIVLLDRFVDSTLAYQGYGRGLDKRIVMELNNLASSGIKPDITFLIDVEPEVALRRLKERDRFEELSFLRKVREGFLEIARKEKERIRVLDGNFSQEELLKMVINELKERLEFV